ncbi:hypothetical protein LSH36_167g01021 [Paralvinella palmiformis]|uniref:Uncharacterized protein n=1 Tax=Paralvinella palmiformis TaxID=53620 RepID=A0AAD9JSX7_9ANNE|nr:hypothetical protein LSH36_167g01021 [Paralvinella palmiformis]
MSDVGNNAHYRPDTCREFFTYTAPGEMSDTERDPVVDDSKQSDSDDDIAFIDASHISDSPPSRYATCSALPDAKSRRLCGHDASSPCQPASPSFLLHPDDVIVTSPAHRIEYHDSAYFHDDDAFVEETNALLPIISEETSTAARIRSYLDNGTRLCDSGCSSPSQAGSGHRAPSRRRRSQQPKVSRCNSTPEDHGDSGYADSSTSTDCPLSATPGDSNGVESGSVDSSFGLSFADRASMTSSPPALSTSGRLLTRRQFHRGTFVRYRYPARYHHRQASSGQETKPSRVQKPNFQPPSCLRPSVRYNKEPIVQRRPPRVDTTKRWPEAPRYPPKSRHAEVECEIIRLVDKLDIGVQCSAPPVRETGCQCSAKTSDSQTQIARVRRKAVAVQTVPKQCSEVGVQNSVPTRNRMVDTDVTVTYFPNELPVTNICSRCRQEGDRCNVNYWVDSNVPQP